MAGLRDGSPRACSSTLSHSINEESLVEPVLSCGNDVGGDVPDELDKEDVVDKPGTTLATGLSVIDGVNLFLKKFMTSFPKYFSKQFGEDIADLCKALVLMCSDFLLWWLVETRLILQEGLLELLLELG